MPICTMGTIEKIVAPTQGASGNREMWVVTGASLDHFRLGERVVVCDMDTLADLAGSDVVICECCEKPVRADDARSDDEGGWLCAECCDELTEQPEEG
jgi:hypothetical protein